MCYLEDGRLSVNHVIDISFFARWRDVKVSGSVTTTRPTLQSFMPNLNGDCWDSVGLFRVHRV